MQFLWLPVEAATAATTTAALLSLFLLYGTPLVLKLDNGSPFVASAMQELLAQWQVIPLYSPPGRPQYNGSIEAGIGALKVRTHYQALRQGRPGVWTLEDTEAACQQGNTLGQPWGAHGPTPAERWAGRQVVTLAERRAFAATVAVWEEETAGPSPSVPATPVPVPAPPETYESGSPPGAAQATASASRPTSAAAGEVARSSQEGVGRAGACPPSAARNEAERGSAEEARPTPEGAAALRRAIRRALVAHGYLRFTRRRIPLPIPRKKVTEIT
jgi:hypothetical protein